MSYTVDNTLISNREMLGQVIAKICNVVAGFFTTLIAHSANNVALEKLNAMSDADLAAKGLTRAQAAEMMFRRDG